MDASKDFLTERQIKAGLKLMGDEDFLFLQTAGGKAIAYFTNHAEIEKVQEAADKYLLEIDWQEK